MTQTKIIDKIRSLHERMLNGEAQTLGEKMQRLSCDAILEGINPADANSKWKLCMRLFASNPAQLRRLSGEEADFNTSTWGKKIQAYIPSNGMCGPATVGFVAPAGSDPRAIGTARVMTTDMINALDRGLDDLDDAQFIADNEAILNNA